ncbi:MAG: DNA-protecting protein DprA [Kineosporiaceae bacterium]|nr:DNA-protecting protein DprA [Kineosporiaceae bacterium]MBK8076931.1 DNA-protecting protein DprA [Kineosporiaceae bacterium]
MESREQELAALLTLLRRKSGGAGWNEIAADAVAAGSATDLLRQPADDALFASPDLEPDHERAISDVRQWARAGLRWVTVLDPDYPSRLLGIREIPPFLFYEGTLHEPDDGMSVVGSRSASAWGLKLATEAARLLVSQGLTVIAGLAAGIDTAAHQAALESSGRTVAFLGTGITHAYPASNRALQREIADHGLLFSQFYPDAPPAKHTFPMRNATMSGYGLATIVIEAGEHSGTRIQARVAGEHGRPVILTDRVAASTSWGAALVGRPHVYVVSSLRDLAAAVNDVREAPARLQSALDELVSA